MRGSLVIVAGCLLSVLLTGCFTMEIAAPYDKDVKLLSPGDAFTAKDEIRVWYALWGLVPISENKLQNIYAARGVTALRAETKFTVLDVIINIFTSWVTICTKTVEVYYTFKPAKRGARGD